jgi:hypothetical protein
MRGGWLLRCFWAPNDVFRYTTMELLDIAAQCTRDEEVAGAVLILSDWEAVQGISRVVPFDVTDQGVKKCAKGRKKRQKQHPRWFAVATSCNDDDNNETVDGSDKEFIMVVGRGFKL